ncbi:hypothetical protein [Tropicimonas isoalkanivorans]|uniref:Phage tail tube protein, TTP n=1 Tax=Tropicimonas isoalkanivorans TaxID=441112 RepID=A0A1I1E5C1_9RHOB|nr:hypothetical protein [Tropicimonas isoalkanivorans]SFB82361.1 hypothetical protein SAMN04488094_101649 [Tropicimonas isoalkanivorans]
MSVYSAKDTLIFISTTSQDTEPANEAAYEALSYTEIGANGEVESIGRFGDTSNEVTFAGLKDGRITRAKGTRDAGTLDLVMAINYADPGQVALVAAEKTDFNYAFKIQFNDAPDGGTPSVRYFIGMVGSAAEEAEGVDAILKFHSSIWINSPVTRVDAAGA